MNKQTGSSNLLPFEEVGGFNVLLSIHLIKKFLDQVKPLIESACDGKVKLSTRELHLSAKIKIQLFPVNETTRLRLEKDGHNPFLELSLSARKKMSSVIKHLDSKWGKSWEGPGELALFPYNTQLKKIVSCRKWTSENSSITAGDLYSLLESPTIFRLRYGWFSGFSLEASGVSSATFPLKDISKPKTSIEIGNLFSLITGNCTKNPTFREYLMTHSVPTTSPVPWEDTCTSLSIGGVLDKFLKSENETSCGLLHPIISTDSKDVQSAWDGDELTSMSIGGLLSEASLMERIGPKAVGPSSSNSKNQILTIDSFDRFISAQNNSYPQHNKPLPLSSRSSILDSEVTCHASDLRKHTTSVGDLDPVNKNNKKKMRNPLPYDDEESSLGIKGVKWNDSRGPFDLGLPMSEFS